MSLQPTKGLIPSAVNLDAIVEFTPEVEAGAVAHGLIDESPKATSRLWLAGRPRHLIFCAHPHNAMMLHFMPNGGWRKLDGAVFLAEYEQDTETGEWRRKDGGDILTGPTIAQMRAAVVVPDETPSGEAPRAERRAVSVVTERSATNATPAPAKSAPSGNPSLPPGLETQAPRVAPPSGELDEMFGGPKPGIGDFSGLPTVRSAVGMSYPAGSIIPTNISRVDLSAALAARPAGPLREEISKGLWDAVLPRALELEEREKARDTTITALRARIAKTGKTP